MPETTKVFQVTASISDGLGDVVTVTRLFDYLPTIAHVADFIQEAGESFNKTSNVAWDTIDENAGARLAKLAGRYLTLAKTIETEAVWPDNIADYRTTKLNFSIAPKSVTGHSLSIYLTLKTTKLWGQCDA